MPKKSINSYAFKNFNVDKCFRDLAKRDLAASESEKGVSVKIPKASLGEFAKEEYGLLRSLAYEAYALTAEIEIHDDGTHEVKRFHRGQDVLHLATRAKILVNSVEKNIRKYPYLNYLPVAKIEKEAGGANRLIPEDILLMANLTDNPSADPVTYEKFVHGLPITSTYSPFGALALVMIDSAITFGKEGNIRNLIDSLYRAHLLIIEGYGLLTRFRNRLWMDGRRRLIASAGGSARADKFKMLEAETIKMYKAGTWGSVPLAAQEITPKIVAMSKNGNGDLLPSTTKPLEWIRAHNKAEKVVSAKHGKGRAG